jgi:tetratricopeptide (TPR) repeat protein
MMTSSSNAMVLLIAVNLLLIANHTSATAVSRADSLKATIPTAENDSARIEVFTELGLALRNTDHEVSRSWYEKADSLASRSGSAKQKIRIYSGRGRLEANAGDNQQSLMFFESALRTARENNYIDLEAENHVNLGIVHKRIGNYPESQSHYLKALSLYSELGNLSGLSRTYQNLGVVTDLLRDLDKAMAYYQKALEIEQVLDRTIDMGMIYGNMAIIEYKRQNLSEAITMLKTTLDYYRDNYPDNMRIPIYINLGNFLIKDTKFNQAQLYLDTASILLQQYPDLQSETSLAYNLSEVWIGLNNLDKAYEYARLNLELAQKLGGFKYISDACQLLSKVYEATGDAQNALEQFRLYKQYNDSLFNETKNREIANYEVQLDIFSKNQLIAEQQFEMFAMNQEVLREKRLRWLFFIIAMLAFTIIYLLIQKFIKNKRVRKKLEEQNDIITRQKQHIESANHILEQQLLRSQLNPHFVFNALSSIQHLVTSGNKAEALGYLSQFSRLLRQVLDTSAETSVLLVEEIKLIEAYIELEALRFGNSFKYTIYIDPELDPYSFEVPALLLQPVIENAIVHGLMPLKSDKFLKIEFHKYEDEIICIVEDNGIGREEASKLKNKHTIKHKSFGINITSQRISNIANKNELDDAISYADLLDTNGNPAGTRVKVSIPALA